MDANANDFGFYLVYTNTKQRKGFKYEPWHYSYKPLSKSYLNAYRKLNLKNIVTSENLMGSDHFSEAFINSYYNGDHFRYKSRASLSNYFKIKNAPQSFEAHS